MSELATIICDARAAFCHCILQPGHDGPHECAEHCGGSWSGNFDDGTFEIVAMPKIPVPQFDEDDP